MQTEGGMLLVFVPGLNESLSFVFVRGAEGLLFAGLSVFAVKNSSPAAEEVET